RGPGRADTNVHSTHCTGCPYLSANRCKISPSSAQFGSTTSPVADIWAHRWQNLMSDRDNGRYEDFDCLSWKYLPVPCCRVCANPCVVQSWHRRRRALCRYIRLSHWTRRSPLDSQSWHRTWL